MTWAQRVAVALSAGLLGVACSSDPSGVETRPPVGFRVSGDSQVRFPGTQLQQRLAIQLVDDSGRDSQTGRIPVTWSVVQGQGTLSTAAGSTSVVGQARTVLTLGPQIGVNRVSVQVGSFEPYVFEARAVVAGPIAFVSNRRSGVPPDPFEGAPADVFVMNADGSDVIQLSPRINETDWVAAPAWSADGTRVAYSRYFRSIVENVYHIRADGEDERTINAAGSSYRDPTWSPDGSELVVVGQDNRIYQVSATGGADLRLITDQQGSAPDWSPDGARLAFSCTQMAASGICAVNVDGSGLRYLTDGTDNDGDPSWSPDGGRILFSRDPDEGGGIWVMNADGSQETQVIQGNASSPDWSPDGTAMVVALLNGTRYDLFHVTLSSGIATNLTNGMGNSWDPVWRE